MALNACTLTAALTATANTLACGLDYDELAVLAAMFTQLGDTLALIALQRGICAEKQHREPKETEAAQE